MKRRRYWVIYLWRGERHVHSADPQTLAEAFEIQGAMKAAGWQCWIESA